MKLEFTTVTQAAALLGLSKRAVIYAIERGEFPGARKLNPEMVTSGWMIPDDAIKSYQKKKRAQTSSA